MSEPQAPPLFVLALSAAFAVLTVAATYYFSLGRNWARVASLVLFVMNLLAAFEVPSLFGRAPLAAWLYLAELLLQAVAMYLAFATSASKAFRRSPRDDAALRSILPVGRSGWAIAAGYLALFSILLLPAPFAIACGFLAIRDIRRHPEKHGMGRAIFGIVMGSLGVVAILGLIGLRMAR